MLLEKSVKLSPGIPDRTADALNTKLCIRVMRFNILLRQNHRIYIIHLAPLFIIAPNSFRFLIYMDKLQFIAPLYFLQAGVNLYCRFQYSA